MENVALPLSTKIIGGFAFAECKCLRKVQLNEGLDVLGAEGNFSQRIFKGHVFQGSALSEITIPSTLKAIEIGTFLDCKSLKSVELPEGL